MTDSGVIDEAAFADAVARYAPLVAARCGRSLKGADVDDAVQAVFLVLWRRRDEAPAEGPALASWLYRTTGFVIQRARRDRMRRRTAEERAAQPEATTMDRPEMSALERAEARALIDDALASLPAPERDAVLLSQLAGHSYAEVAEQQGCAKATVAARVQQGLGALRRRLTARGCTLSLAGLVALLGDEAHAAVPDALVARVHRLPRAAMAGTTAAVVGARILQWSTRESPIVKIIVVAGAAVLCVATLFLATHGAAADRPEPARAAIEAAPPVNPPPETEDQRVARVAQAMRADVGVVVRWRRPLDSWRGIVDSPIGAMLPGTIVDTISGELAGIEDIELRMDPMSMFRPEEMEAVLLDAAKGHLGGPAKQQEMMREQRKALLERREVPGTPKHPPTLGGFPAYRADAVARFSDDAAAERWRARIADRLAATPGEDGTVSLSGDDCSLAFTASPRVLGMRMRTAWNDGDLAWMSTPQGPADVTMRMVMRPHDPRAYADILGVPPQEIIEAGHLTFWIDRGRFRMTAASIAQGTQQRDMLAGMPTLAADVWQRVPPEALLAGAWAMRGSDVFTSALLEGMLLQVSTQDEGGTMAALIAAVRGIGAEVDGALIGYLEPVGAMPALTAALPTTPGSARALVDAIAGLLGQAPADGIVRIPAMLFLFQLGYHDGHLVCTSNPAGVAAFAVHGAAFAQVPDVAASLVATGDAPAMARLLVRTDRLIDLAVPMAAASGLPHEEVAGMEEASRRLEEEREAGWMVMRADEDGFNAEASGIAAVIAAIAAAGAGAAAGVSGIN
ncbi:MAG TPA: sigma-70 family RNA polymerase sigma factor [Planctomycetota bacterium]|nr:sigma-70 family RNA polymerase sigma factor [Planctomycetota bacterium]